MGAVGLVLNNLVMSFVELIVGLITGLFELIINLNGKPAIVVYEVVRNEVFELNMDDIDLLVIFVKQRCVFIMIVLEFEY